MYNIILTTIYYNSNIKYINRKDGIRNENNYIFK